MRPLHLRDSLSHTALMKPEHHILACALEVERQHDRDAWMFATLRIQDLIAQGDLEGVRVWHRIRQIILALRKGSRGSRH
jgi:hypothetical protein